MKDRCREEIVMTSSEMESLVNFKLKEISLISNKTKEAPATQFGVGLKSLLLQKAANYKNKLSLKSLQRTFFKQFALNSCGDIALNAVAKPARKFGHAMQIFLCL